MSKTIYKVQIWLKSQSAPVELETSWAFYDERELNDLSHQFIKIEENIYRKDDIVKILKVGQREVEEKDQKEGMPF